MALTADIARQILVQAKNDETYEADVPEDDETAISEANDLVEQARAAWEANVRGPEVEAILNIAGSGDEGDGDGDDNPTEGDDGDGEGEENLAEIEPWEDYDKDGVQAVKDGLDEFLAEDPDSFQDVAAHVYEYESANKARSGVIAHLEKLAEQINAQTEDETGEDAEGGADPEDEAGSGDEAGDADGEGDGEEAASAAGADESDASDDTGGEAEGGGEEEAADAEAAAASGPAGTVLTITREDILAALSDGHVEIVL